MGSRLGPSGHWHGHPRGRLAHQTAPRAAQAKAHLAEGYRAMRRVVVENHHGVEQDNAQAVHWYKLAAAHGHVDAHIRIGVLLESGQGPKQDHAQALHWFMLLASKGNAVAQIHVGMVLDRGLGVEIDDAKALVYYSKAAKKGDPYAIKNRDIIEARLAAEHENK